MYYDEAKKMALGSQIVWPKEVTSWVTVGTATAKHRAPPHWIKLYVRAAMESDMQMIKKNINNRVMVDDQMDNKISNTSQDLIDVLNSQIWRPAFKRQL